MTNDTNNENSLQTLVRAITLSQGQFSLILVRCNYASLRETIVQRLREVSPVNIHEITLSASVKTLYTAISEAISEQSGDEQPPALMVFGLESVKNLDTILTSANQVREEFRKNFQFPILLWVNDQVLQQFIRLATDLESWATTVELKKKTDDLVRFLEQKIAEVFAGDVIPNLQVCWELEAAKDDLESRGQVLSAEIRGCIEFVLGLHDYQRDRINSAFEHYQQSLNFWRSPQPPLEREAIEENINTLERRGKLLLYIALAYYRLAEKYHLQNQENWEAASDYFQQSFDVFRQAQKEYLVAEYINKLGEVLRQLKLWDELQNLAESSLTLHQNYNLPRHLAEDYGFLAEVALEKSYWQEANQFAQQALQIFSAASSQELHEQGWLRFLLARSQQNLGEVAAAISYLEIAREESNPQYDPKLYIRILETLRLLYYEQKNYLEAFRIKQEQIALEYQYGLRAFIGANYLQPQRYTINPDLVQAEKQAVVAQEIAASGRQEDVRRLVERISSTQHKLIVIHGQSGVGKSSILQAGLIPALQQKPIEARDVLPVLLRVYTDWVGMLGRCLAAGFEEIRGNKLSIPVDAGGIIEQLRRNAERNLLTVLIFDQFEEFFFVYSEKVNRRAFYDFLRQCLDIPFTKVVLSLREDYLHYLLELDRLFNLTVINNNILDKNIRYYLGNFSPADAKKVVQSLTERTQFGLQPALIDQLVADLAGDLGEVRPIELQIVGAQLQTEKINTIEKYQEVGTKEKLVERFLEAVIQDCGVENERCARLVLYLLTDENGTRPLKTRAQLADDLVAEVEKLDLVLEIVVKSGLVVLIPEKPADLYQLVHDYLVDFIRRYQSDELLAELAREREQRQLAEENLKREQEANQILADAKREADRQIQQGRRRFFVSSGLSVLLLVGAGIAAMNAVNQIKEANAAKEEKQQAETQVSQAKVELDKVNKQKTEIATRAKELETKEQTARKNYQQAQAKQKDAEVKLTAAQQETQQANQTLAQAKAQLQNLNKQNSALQNQNAQALERINTASQKVKTAEEKAQQAEEQQKLAEAKMTTANQTLAQAQATLKKTQQAAQVAQENAKQAQIAQQEAKQGTELERAGVNALRQFEFAEIEALVSAMQSGKQLKNLVKDDRTVGEYPAISPVFALHTILDDIKELNQFPGHQDSVLSVSFSPDGKYLATASDDKTARLWNLKGELITQFKGHQDYVRGVSFSPDGKYLATVSYDKTARLWNLKGELITQFKGHQDSVLSVSFSPDGKYLATASLDGTARLWPVESLDELLVRGCNWLQFYLKNPNVNLRDEDRHLCDDINVREQGTGNEECECWGLKREHWGLKREY
ncbi:MAG: hypothetical protein NHB32_29025 [Fischerella sp. CENA71]|nr:hypothetical protein [Fischerella sp. CENA71]